MDKVPGWFRYWLSGDWTALVSWKLVVIALTSLPWASGDQQVCSSGFYLHGANTAGEDCLPCTDGVNFMPQSQHRMEECYNCTLVVDEGLEVLVSACNSTHDTQFLCRAGYFRQEASLDIADTPRCVLCSECQHVGRTCGQSHDAICCDQAAMIVVDTETGPQCQSSIGSDTTDHFLAPSEETPFMESVTTCGKDQFVYVSPRTGWSVCLPCPVGSHTELSNHTLTSCQESQKPEGGAVAMDPDTKCQESPNDFRTAAIVVIAMLVAAVCVLVVFLVLTCFKFRATREKISHVKELYATVERLKAERAEYRARERKEKIMMENQEKENNVKENTEKETKVTENNQKENNEKEKKDISDIEFGPLLPQEGIKRADSIFGSEWNKLCQEDEDEVPELNSDRGYSEKMGHFTGRRQSIW